jgi:hypothetical protein
MLLRCCMCPYEAITVYSFPKPSMILHLLGLSTITRYVPVFLNSVLLALLADGL